MASNYSTIHSLPARYLRADLFQFIDIDRFHSWIENKLYPNTAKSSHALVTLNYFQVSELWIRPDTFKFDRKVWEETFQDLKLQVDHCYVDTPFQFMV